MKEMWNELRSTRLALFFSTAGMAFFCARLAASRMLSRYASTFAGAVEAHQVFACAASALLLATMLLQQS